MEPASSFDSGLSDLGMGEAFAMMLLVANDE
jgi:hypothetical protein